MFASGKAASASAANYIEDVFSTYLYTGTGSALTVTNGIDLAGKGGLVWVKRRDTAVNNFVFDTARGVGNYLITNSTGAQSNLEGVSAFNSNGFSVGTAITTGMNTSGGLYASWTFREQPKFFDVVTYTGNGSARTIAHNLGSVPGCIIVKRTDSANDWFVYHRSLTNEKAIYLDLTNAAAFDSSWNNTDPTSTVFSVGSSSNVNASGGSFVAYLFAHDAGGFGLTGTDNVISCGSFNAASAGSVNLGYEPQWIIAKTTDISNPWYIWDNMRGFASGTSTTNRRLLANTSDAEANATGVAPTATGFDHSALGNNWIYIAIRRGPMKVPTSGTSVFSPIAANNAQGTQNTTGFPVDLQLQAWRSGVNSKIAVDRLRGVSTNATNGEKYLVTDTTAAEVAGTNLTQYWNNTGFQTASGWASFSNVYWNFRRAPSFFDEVCYTGTGATIALNHNLAAVPELMIVKSRGAATGNWVTYTATYGSGSFIRLNSTSGNNTGAGNLWGATTPTSSLFYVGEGGAGGLSVSANNYVAYLFATCAGVSKVGSYTGTGTTLQVNCGFTGGARFVLIKRTDSTGDWYVWDSARGIVAGNDPYLLLNSTAAEVTSTDYIDTYSAGFEISSTAPAAINASGGTFIFLAIA